MGGGGQGYGAQNDDGESLILAGILNRIFKELVKDNRNLYFQRETFILKVFVIIVLFARQENE